MNRAFRRGWLIALAVLVAPARSREVAVGPLAPTAHWVGGQWVTTFKTPKGEEIRTIRSYEWSFDGRVMFGRSLAREGR